MFRGKVVVVTGAARGIGLAIANRFAKEGAHVVMLDINTAVETAFAQILATHPGNQGFAMVSDIRHTEQVSTAMAQTMQRLGRLDFLINNAGLLIEKLVVDLTDQDWDNLMDVNAGGVFRCCREALKYMIPRKFGRIVNIASQIGKLSEPYNAAYGASKAAVIRFSQALALEVAQYGINVNTICPGITATEMIKQSLADRARFEGISIEAHTVSVCKGIPLRRMAEPSEIAGLVAFLCGEESAYMTGQAINISGGRTMI